MKRSLREGTACPGARLAVTLGDYFLCLHNAFARRFVQLISHVAATGVDVTLPGVRAACVAKELADGRPTLHSARYGATAVSSECMVMWALHRSYGITNVRMLPDWADERKYLH
jgi:hypothetical protein